MTKGFTSTGKLVQVSNRIPPNQRLKTGFAAVQVGSGEFPDRASVDRDSPFYHDFAGADVGIRLNGMFRPQNDVHEYCVSEGWIKVPARLNGKIRKERGKPVLLTIRGTVEPFWRKP